MKRSSLLLCLSALLSTGTAFSQTLEVPRKVAKALHKTKPADIKKHIAYLADDKLKGRKPGTEGYQMAVDYVVNQYKKLGVEPGGENNSYLQLVRLRQSFLGPDATFSRQPTQGGEAQSFTVGQDVAIYPHPEENQTSVSAPVVFVGHGITAPDLGYDDYAGQNVKGKIVLVMRGAPKSFPSTVASYSIDVTTILKNAADHGAVGVIIGANTQNPKATVPNLSRGVNSVADANGKVATSRNFVSPQIKLLANLSAVSTQHMFSKAGLDTAQVFTTLRSGKPASADLKQTVKASYTSSNKDFDSWNVIGKITGADPQLKNEYVVHSAHLDHVGITAPVNGDSINNGAHDNASGVASLLEIARTYSRLKEKPKRSILIVMVTAEEMGLLGSAYFAKYPTVPKSSIVADINTDMPTIIAPLLSVVGLGSQHSTLETPVANAAAYLGMTVEADPEPNENRFIRSDQYSFVTQGVPALHIKYGNKTADGLNNLNKKVAEWRAVHYHKPQDELNDTFDFDAGRKYVQLNFLISYQVANTPARPTWKKGDFFGTRFGQK
ncbi:M20/M25/M40 family metallo-hydrolase [Nibribacter ruber]|uniref:M20/M25/M40 family metallo-hydrolase n=1 Tax=Nibribacter ruber TaxID=2698458 RepID=A0A6P1P4A5_9BACT|nr:M28 family peptidase [Nibribacter ruber]QHL89274.1 M20/M25/M40 family metallo-hydrolase [Nibribacter ruber]